MAGKCNRIAGIVEAAFAAGTVVPAFNTPYIPIMKGVVDALKDLDAFGMIEVARLEVTKFEAQSFAAVAREYARVGDPHCTSLHLDHIPVIDEDGEVVDWRSDIMEALDLGYDSVMIDGSRLPLEENIAVTAKVVELAHSVGAKVEAELGSVLGHESGHLPPYDEIFESKLGFTKPEEAERFVRESGVDWLSVSVGSVHGAIAPAVRHNKKTEARIDIEHLRLLREAAGVPLVLHGGSGIQQSYIDAAIESGIAKINVATDIRQAYEKALSDGGSVEDGQRAVYDAVKLLVENNYNITGSASRLRKLADAIV